MRNKDGNEFDGWCWPGEGGWIGTPLLIGVDVGGGGSGMGGFGVGVGVEVGWDLMGGWALRFAFPGRVYAPMAALLAGLGGSAPRQQRVGCWM